MRLMRLAGFLGQVERRLTVELRCAVTTERIRSFAQCKLGQLQYRGTELHCADS
ncbi:hypothetical protein ElyMa_002661400 [Elysia marginata]|uniref:Uncharacterized protein n=1 Tax=Elysia marginata TaxID=1093978 RepID=A0AAV4HBP7_9GAST|nr:hypothetical protein ElyMa_002661400 [Elysia marginata]